jgi:hypothetical protein
VPHGYDTGSRWSLGAKISGGQFDAIITLAAKKTGKADQAQ